MACRAASTAMTSFSVITDPGQRFAHWIMGTLECKSSTVVTYTLNKSALIRSAVHACSLLSFQHVNGLLGKDSMSESFRIIFHDKLHA